MEVDPLMDFQYNIVYRSLMTKLTITISLMT